MDKHARVGYKTRKDGGLIISMGVHDGAYVDGSEFARLYEAAERSGLELRSVCGDQ